MSPIEIIVIISAVAYMFLIYMMIKANRTSDLIEMLNDAIHDYNIYQINHHDYSTGTNAPVIKYLYQRDKKIFGKTLWRLWDWGYRRIIPAEDLELIKPFVKED